jgi:hypothetical protein
MAQIVKKFIGDNQVGALKARLENNSYLRGRNAADNADVNMFKVNASDIIEAASLPQFSGSSFATQSYVDSAVSASAQVAKQAVLVVSTSNLTLSGEQTIDGVLTSTSRILVAGQTTAADNGIYVTAAGAWARSTDADVSGEIFRGMSVFVSSGTLYDNTVWFLDGSGAITLGSTSLSFIKETNVPKKENLTLNGTDITNQYKDLALTAKTDSVFLSVNGVVQYEGTDYTLSIVSGVTRVTFAGDLATGGGAALISGDILRLQYLY